MIGTRSSIDVEWRMLARAVAYTIPSRKQRIWLQSLAESAPFISESFFQANPREMATSGNEATPKHPIDEGAALAPIVQVLLHVTQAGLATEYLQIQETAAEGDMALKRSLRYPVYLLFMAGLSLSILAWMGARITKISEFESINAQLPSALSLMGLEYSVPLFGLVALAAYAMTRWIGGPIALARVEGSLPLIGKVKRQQATSELASLTSLLMRCGLSIEEALDLAGKSSNHPINQVLSLGILEDLRRGQTITQALASRTWFPGWLVEFVYRGMARGETMDRILRDSSDLLDIQWQTESRNMARFLTPLLFCIVLVVVQFFYLSMIMNAIRTFSGVF